MTVFSLPRLGSLDWHKSSHVLPLALAALLGAGALAIVAYLLWPTWALEASSTPERLPVSVGGTLFNPPTAAIAAPTRNALRYPCSAELSNSVRADAVRPWVVTAVFSQLRATVVATGLAARGIRRLPLGEILREQ